MSKTTMLTQEQAEAWSLRLWMEAKATPAAKRHLVIANALMAVSKGEPFATLGDPPTASYQGLVRVNDSLPGREGDEPFWVARQRPGTVGRIMAYREDLLPSGFLRVRHDGCGLAVVYACADLRTQVCHACGDTGVDPNSPADAYGADPCRSCR